MTWGDYIPLIMGIINPIIKNVNKAKGDMVLIKFDKLWATMEKKNVSTYWLREKCGIDRKTIRRLKANENIETKTLNKLCSVLDCALEDIAEFVKDEV